MREQLVQHRCADAVVRFVSRSLARSFVPDIEGLLAVRRTMIRAGSTSPALLAVSMAPATSWLSMLVITNRPLPPVHSLTQSRAHCVRPGPCQ